MADPILAIDAGTTGVTSILFDAELEPLTKAYREFDQGFPRPGWVEHGSRAKKEIIKREKKDKKS